MLSIPRRVFNHPKFWDFCLKIYFRVAQNTRECPECKSYIGRLLALVRKYNCHNLTRLRSYPDECPCNVWSDFNKCFMNQKKLFTSYHITSHHITSHHIISYISYRIVSPHHTSPSHHNHIASHITSCEFRVGLITSSEFLTRLCQTSSINMESNDHLLLRKCWWIWQCVLWDISSSSHWWGYYHQMSASDLIYK